MTKHSPDPKAAGTPATDEKVSRLVESLAELCVVNLPPKQDENPFGPDDLKLSEQFVSWLIALRRRRAPHFPTELLSAPAWDIMLELLHARLRDRRLASPALCAASGVAPAIALRWLDALEERGLIVRCGDRQGLDGECFELSATAIAAFCGYFHDVAQSNGR